MNNYRICAIGIIFLAAAASLNATVPPLMSYQGKLADEYGEPVPDGDYSMWFRIYDDSTDGNVLWEEEQTSVNVVGGLFNVLLGGVESIPDTVFTGGMRWLGIQVSPDPEMSPRKPIVSVPYAFTDCDWMADSSDIYRIDGDVGVGGIPPGDAKLYVHADTTGWKYALYAEGPHGIKGINTSLAGTGVTGEGGHAGVAGDGGYIGVVGHGFYGGWFEGRGYFSGDVGIGTSDADTTLHLIGNIKIVDGNEGAGKVLTSDANGVGSWQTAGSDNDWLITGNVLSPSADYGLSMRQSNVMYGTHDSTHVNFGIACTTGTSGQDYSHCTVSGGRGNSASNYYAVVGGGVYNTASANYATVGGGGSNTASGDRATVGGGGTNSASGYRATVGGGYGNTASGYGGTVAGGQSNTASSNNATVGGGVLNTAANYATVAGGYNNIAANSATVGGGGQNTANEIAATVGGGSSNTASGQQATVSGGYQNTASGERATVGGGEADTVAGDYSFASGRQVVIDATADYTFAFGRDFTTSTASAVVFHNSQAPIKMAVGDPTPTATLDVKGSTGYDQVRMRTSYTPTGTSDANGNVGDIAWDDSYVYIKTDAGWKRTALSMW